MFLAMLWQASLEDQDQAQQVQQLQHQEEVLKKCLKAVKCILQSATIISVWDPSSTMVGRTSDKAAG